jgi:hypothetical protein
MAKGSFAFEPFAFLEASTQSGQLGVGAGLIEENQSCLLLTHDGLTALDPFHPCLGNVRPVLLACQKAFFYS